MPCRKVWFSWSMGCNTWSSNKNSPKLIWDRNVLPHHPKSSKLEWKSPAISGKSRLVKYYFIWPDGERLGVFFSSWCGGSTFPGAHLWLWSIFNSSRHLDFFGNKSKMTWLPARWAPRKPVTVYVSKVIITITPFQGVKKSTSYYPFIWL